MIKGRLVAVSRLAASPKEKEDLRNASGAVAVDMESAAVAGLASANASSFGAIRVISDDYSTALSPALVDLFSGPQVSALAVALVLVRHPRVIAQLWRLASNTRLAAKRLAIGLEQSFLKGRSVESRG
jgi:nucleoside phosphorylase